MLGVAVLAVLAAVLPPARGRRRLHRAARAGGRRRQSAVVSVVARRAKAGAVAGRRRGARTADRSLAQYDGDTIAHHAAGAQIAADARRPRARGALPPPYQGRSGRGPVLGAMVHGLNPRSRAARTSDAP